MLLHIQLLTVCPLSSQPENVRAVEVGQSNVPEIKLIHFERSREVLPDSELTVSRLHREIDFEGTVPHIVDCTWS